MNTRARSPNYPAISLPRSIELARRVYELHRLKVISNSQAAFAMGFSSLNGNSATAISALKKFAILKKVNADLQLTELAEAVLSQHQSTKDRAQKFKKMAFSPELFLQIANNFPDKNLKEGLLRDYLLGNGFISSTVDLAIRSYRETIEFVEQETAKSAILPRSETAGPRSAPQESVELSVAESRLAPRFQGVEQEEQEWLHGHLTANVSFRLLLKGRIGPKELGKLIVLLQAQKQVLEEI